MRPPIFASVRQGVSREIQWKGRSRGGFAYDRIVRPRRGLLAWSLESGGRTCPAGTRALVRARDQFSRREGEDLQADERPARPVPGGSAPSRARPRPVEILDAESADLIRVGGGPVPGVPPERELDSRPSGMTSKALVEQVRVNARADITPLSWPARRFPGIHMSSMPTLEKIVLARLDVVCFGSRPCASAACEHNGALVQRVRGHGLR